MPSDPLYVPPSHLTAPTPPDDGLPCSRCPILDFGEKYPEHDARDPWRRMPRMFLKAQALFGQSMYAHKGRSRIELEKRLGHVCRVTREKHGPCGTARIKACVTAFQGQLDRARTEAPDKQKRRSFAYAGITRLANDDDHHAQMKATRIADPTPGLRMPPITFEEMPDD